MSRPLRLAIPGAFYHVMNRGANKAPIFHEINDRFLFLLTLRDTVEQWKIRLHAYSLMENHYHLLIETPLGNISRAIRHLDHVYTQRYNRKYDHDGPLFRGRFKSILVEEKPYFLELVRYIHMNAVRAGKCPSPDRDRFSSHPHYLNPKQELAWITTGLALSYFGSDPEQCRRSFDAFVREGVSEDIRRVIDKKRWPAVLGTEAFLEEIRAGIPLAPNVQREQPQTKRLWQPIPPEKIVSTVLTTYGVGPEWISKQRHRHHNEVRRTAIYLLRHVGRLSYAQIGKQAGNLTHTPIARICLTPLDRMVQDEKFSQLWGALQRDLEGGRVK